MTQLPTRQIRIALAAAVIGFMPVVGLAQPSTTWPGLNAAALQTVYVQDRTGSETTGRLLSLSDESVRLLMAGGVERRFPISDVVRIQKRDSLKNGVLIGAGVGLAMGIIGAGISDCPESRQRCGGARAALLGFSIGVYAGFGAGIDALVRGRTTIYSATPLASLALPSAARVPVRSAGDHRRTLQFGLRW